LFSKPNGPKEILLTTEDNIFARVGKYKSASLMNLKSKFAREADGAKEFYDLD
jgi:hypothetical protein